MWLFLFCMDVCGGLLFDAQLTQNISLSQTSINKIAWVSYEIEKVTSGCTMGFDSAYYL